MAFTSSIGLKVVFRKPKYTYRDRRSHCYCFKIHFLVCYLKIAFICGTFALKCNLPFYFDYFCFEMVFIGVCYCFKIHGSVFSFVLLFHCCFAIHNSAVLLLRVELFPTQRFYSQLSGSILSVL